MRCEYCTRKLGSKEVAHGIRYGTYDERADTFLPDKESAATILCQICGESLLKLIYQKINNPTYL